MRRIPAETIPPCAAMGIIQWDAKSLEDKRKICFQECLIRRECLSLANSFEEDDIQHLWGVWGGLTDRERVQNRSGDVQVKNIKEFCEFGHLMKHGGCPECRAASRKLHTRKSSQKELACASGHEWRQGSYVVTKKGYRSCLQCREDRKDERARVCKKGHVIEGDNLKVDVSGTRTRYRCRKCTNERARRNAKRRAEAKNKSRIQNTAKDL